MTNKSYSTPWWLRIIFILFALNVPFQISYFYEHTLGEWELIWEKITILNTLIIFTFTGLGFNHFKNKLIFNKFLIFSVILVFINNLFVSLYSEEYGFIVPQLASLFYGVFCFGLVKYDQWLKSKTENFESSTEQNNLKDAA